MFGDRGEQEQFELVGLYQSKLKENFSLNHRKEGVLYQVGWPRHKGVVGNRSNINLLVSKSKDQ